jgi:hypothetical protein
MNKSTSGEDNAFFCDNTNQRFGIGITTQQTTDDFKKKYVNRSFMMFLCWHLFIYFIGILMGFLIFETNLYWIVILFSLIFGFSFFSVSKFLAELIFK